MRRLRALLAFIRRGPFAGHHKPARFDDHTYQAFGIDAEDRTDQYSSAMADREREIRYWTEMAS